LKPLLQIVPRAPGGQDGVGDQALNLAGHLRSRSGWETIFLSAAPAKEENVTGGFRVCSPLRRLAQALQTGDNPRIILHYVGYGYGRRGTPLWLPETLSRIKGSGRLLTIFHELYATGSIRQSAFWLQPIQKRIVRAIADMSDTAVVSNNFSRRQLRRLAPGVRIVMQPVMSNFGEPHLSSTDLDERDPHRWVICGGTELVERSITSFVRIADRIAEGQVPRELFVFGGRENPCVRMILEKERRFKSYYRPNIALEDASRILGGCTFGWFDYFAHVGVPIDLILKSSAFAACCAHGVIPVVPDPNGTIEGFPGTFFVGRKEQQLPAKTEQSQTAGAIYQWYHQNASSARLTAAIDTALADLA
jgi:hypothetical protein